MVLHKHNLSLFYVVTVLFTLKHFKELKNVKQNSNVIAILPKQDKIIYK